MMMFQQETELLRELIEQILSGEIMRVQNSTSYEKK